MNRIDGRAADELRAVSFETGFTAYAEGSVLVSFGGTKVLCNASVEAGVPRWMKGQGRGWITAEYGMLPRATHTRGGREAARGKQSGRTQEIQRLIGRSLRAMIDLEKLGEHTIVLDCDVIQADGGTRTASVTGAAVALTQAVQWLMRENPSMQNPLLARVAAVSVGMKEGQALLDLNYAEDSTCDTDLNVVMNAEGHFIEVQGTAEEAPFSRSELDAMLASAESGLKQLIRLQEEALG